MNAIREMSLPVLMALLLIGGPTYAENNPKDADAYYDRGVAYHKKGQFDRAISDYTKALEINPGYVKAYNNRGSAYKSKGQFDRAISDYTKALEISPKDANAHYNRGNVYFRKGQLEHAISDYNKVIEINPKIANAYKNRGLVYFVKLGNKVKGCADWKKACELGECRIYNSAKHKGDCP